MSTFTRLAAKFGFNQPIPMEKLPPKTRELTQMVESTSQRVQATIAHLESISDLRRTPATAVKGPMCRKYKGNVAVKIGYGQRNETISSDLYEVFFPSLSQALEYLREVETFIHEGGLDSALSALLVKYQKRAEQAREKRRKRLPKATVTIPKIVEIPNQKVFAAK